MTMRRGTMWLAIMLAAVMAMTACNSAATKGGSDSSGAPAGASAEEPVELTMTIMLVGSMPKDLQLVEDEINKIAIEKINAKVKIVPINFSNYNQQINLMLSGGEKLDFGVIFGSPTLSSYILQGSLLPLDDLLDKYGQGIVETLGDYIKAGRLNGQTYAVTTVRSEYGSQLGITMRKDLVDKYKIDISQIQTLDDLDPVFQAIKQNEPELVPVVGYGGSSILSSPGFYPVDTLGDMFGVLTDYGKELQVVNWFETEAYANLLKTVRRWFNDGYISKDAATETQTGTTLIGAGKAFSMIYNHNPTDMSRITSGVGDIPLVSKTFYQPFSYSSMVQTIQYGIFHHSRHPDKAMQFLNLMYTDKDIVNLLNWGIEGTHYIVGADGAIDYPPGVDAATTGYAPNIGFEVGNLFLSHVWKGQEADLWEKADAFNKSAIKSKAFGFMYDAASVKNELTALSNVLNQYYSGLETGSIDPEKQLPEFISKLKAAGIDKVMSEKQRQLDEWAKTNQ